MEIHPKRLSWISKRLSWILLGFILLLGIILALHYRSRSLIETVKIKIIENPNGLKFVEEEDVIKIIQDKLNISLGGQPIGTLKDNFIQDAEVYIDAQNSVHIEITQREPMLRVVETSGETYYLDKNGEAIKDAQIGTSGKYAARVLVLTGDLGKYAANYKELSTSRLRKAFELAQYIQKSEFLRAQIEQIHTEANGEVILVPKVGDHLIPFGAANERIEEKFKHLEIFYKEGLSREGWDKYKSVSLAYKKQIVAKKR
jgi:cell division protein FtsQ